MELTKLGRCGKRRVEENTKVSRFVDYENTGNEPPDESINKSLST